MNILVLEEFCAQLGIEKQKVLDAERPDRYFLTAAVSAENLDGIGPAQITDLFNGLAGIINLTIGEASRPIISVSQREPPILDNLEKSFRSLKSLALSSIAVTIDIDKRAMLAWFAVTSAEFTGRLFLFEHNFSKLLDGSLTLLDSTLFGNESKSTVVIVLDANLLVEGPLLTIIGGAEIDQLPGLLKGLRPRTQQNLHRFQRIRQDLNWDGFVLQSLTPLHFVVAGSARGSDSHILEKLANKLVQTLIVYSANRTVVTGASWESVYANPDQQAGVHLSDTSISEEQCRLIMRLFVWLQSADDHQDRLIMFQNVVARELHGVAASDSYFELLGRLASILAETRWNYRVHLDGKIDKHFEKMEAAEAYVTSTISEVSKSIDEVIKGLTSSLVTAIGFVVLTLIASLLEDKSRGQIFAFAMGAYGLYLFIFQALYQMLLIRHGVHLNLDALNVVLSPYRAALGAAKIDHLLCPLEKRKQFYRQVFWITQTLYGVVIVAVFILAWLLPQQLFSPQSGNSLPIPTPTVQVPATLSPPIQGVSPVTATSVGATPAPTPTP